MHCGCKVNQYETNKIEEAFINEGYEIVKNQETADVYVINTCAVTNVAEKKSRQMFRRAKQINPKAIIIVCGCYVQIAKEELEKFKDIDILLDNKEKNNIIEYLRKFKKENQNIITDKIKKESKINIEKNRAVVKIQDGCNMFCTYCIIPYARGRIQSRNVDDILKEVENIANNNIKEVVITGIHIASYGKDFENSNIRLIDLLEKINKIDGIERIRLGSLEPTIITEEFLKRLTKLEKICDHFHLSLQSGCDTVLKRMNRKYTTTQFKEISDMLKKAYPNVHLTTDIIVGFPGETDEEFNTTYNFLKDIEFYKMHIFKYSRRKGTVADKMPNQIDGKIKEQRSNKLINLSNENENRYNKKYIGEKVKVLFEEVENGYLKGHTTNYMVINAIANDKKENNYINKIKYVEISQNDSKSMELIGKVIDND